MKTRNLGQSPTVL